MYRALIFATLMSIALASLFEDVRELKELLEFEEEERQIYKETLGKKETLSEKADNYQRCMVRYSYCSGHGDCEPIDEIKNYINYWQCECTGGYTGDICNTAPTTNNAKKAVLVNKAKKSYGGLVQKLRELLEEENY